MDLNEEIAKVAYELYERDGRQHGKDREHWLEAEQIVKDRLAKQNKAESGREKTPKPKKTMPKQASAPVKKAKETSKQSAQATTKKAEKPARKPGAK